MINERLKGLRKEYKVTQKAVAKAIGLGEQNYQAFEYGKVKPSHDSIIALADYFNVSADYLLGRTNYPGMAEDGQRNTNAD